MGEASPPLPSDKLRENRESSPIILFPFSSFYEIAERKFDNFIIILREGRKSPPKRKGLCDNNLLSFSHQFGGEDGGGVKGTTLGLGHFSPPFGRMRSHSLQHPPTWTGSGCCLLLVVAVSLLWRVYLRVGSLKVGGKTRLALAPRRTSSSSLEAALIICLHFLFQV